MRTDGGRGDVREPVAAAEPALLFFGKPEIDEAEIAAVTEVLRGGWLSKGARCTEFERAIAARSGARAGVFLNSCTAALHLSLLAHGVGPGDDVLTTTLTFVATAQAIEMCGATPVLCDVDARTMNCTPETVARALTPKTKAVIGVHFGGRAFDIAGVARAAGGAAVIEDAAHAFGAIDRLGRPVGASGNLVAFSFYPNKCITTGEGGMIVLDDEDLAQRLRAMAHHGLAFGAWAAFRDRTGARARATLPGYKYHSTEINAALGLEQLKKSAAFAQRRAEIATAYDGLFAGDDALELQAPYEPLERSANHLYVVRLNADGLRGTRDDVVAALREAGILASVHYEPVHTQPWYADRYGWKPGDFPVALDISQRTLTLPNHPSLQDGDVDRIATTLRGIVRGMRR